MYSTRSRDLLGKQDSHVEQSRKRGWFKCVVSDELTLEAIPLEVVLEAI